MKLRAFIQTILSGIGASLFRRSLLGGDARFTIDVRILSPEVVASSLFGLSQASGDRWWVEAYIVLNNHIRKHRALIIDNWSNPSYHIALEGPPFEPAGEMEARQILNEACHYAIMSRKKAA